MINLLRFISRLFLGLLNFLRASTSALYSFAANFIISFRRVFKVLFIGSALYLIAALTLVYIYAPVRGMIGAYWHEKDIHYANERWLGTAIYDRKKRFVGTFDPRLDSQRDLNLKDTPLSAKGTDYLAHPDHKSIPVTQVPAPFWNCLQYLEDRNMGTWKNPAGIDLYGVLKIPVTTVKRSLAAGKPRLGVGGSTLAMQLTRVFHKTPPSVKEGAFGKVRRKLTEYWYAPIFYHVLTKNNDIEPFKLWTANHIWIAQGTGGRSLQGVELAGRVIFGKAAKDLSVAQHYVLAAAVNKPINLRSGKETITSQQLKNWRRIVEQRAKTCVTGLQGTDKLKKELLFELATLAEGAPKGHIAPSLQTTIDKISPRYASVAKANPVLRANLLIPTARLGAREEMKQRFGYNWRRFVRGVDLSLNIEKNRLFRDVIKTKLTALQQEFGSKLNSGFALDPAQTVEGTAIDMPDVILAASNHKGEIVRYFESRSTSSFYGSTYARDKGTGKYMREKESRAIASIGKIMAAIRLANGGKDTLYSPYVDVAAPPPALQNTCQRGNQKGTRTAQISFACSLNTPLEGRLARMGQVGAQALINDFGFTMPHAKTKQDATPPTTAMVRGLVSSSPQRLLQMSTLVLNSLTGRGKLPVPLPSMITKFHQSVPNNHTVSQEASPNTSLIPNEIIKPAARPLLRKFLKSPLCTQVKSKPIGTLHKLRHWCADVNTHVNLHFAKTGTQVTGDASQTVDVLLSGGIQFRSRRAYSYVVIVGTGNRNRPFATNLHASQLAAPLLDELLKDLAEGD